MMTIWVDTSEQRPYRFTDLPAHGPYRVERHSLDTADYLVDPQAPQAEFIKPARSAIVERKSLADLYGTVGRGRRRFEAELARMGAYGFRAIVIEAEWSQILNPNAHLVKPTKMLPKSMLASLLAWQQRYNVHVIPCPGRAAAERITFRLLERWFRDQQKEESMNMTTTSARPETSRLRQQGGCSGHYE